MKRFAAAFLVVLALAAALGASAEAQEPGSLITRDRSGANVGRIDGDGAVRDRSGSLSGRFQGYEPAHRHAAAAYLVFFNPLHGH